MSSIPSANTTLRAEDQKLSNDLICDFWIGSRKCGSDEFCYDNSSYSSKQHLHDEHEYPLQDNSELTSVPASERTDCIGLQALSSSSRIRPTTGSGSDRPIITVGVGSLSFPWTAGRVRPGWLLQHLNSTAYIDTPPCS